MSTTHTHVRVRIESATKERAADALGATGLSISDAIRLLMVHIADERQSPFELRVPNAPIREAISELEAGKGKRFNTVPDLVNDLVAAITPQNRHAAIDYGPAVGGEAW